jgi:hypothetical protein
VKPVALKVSVNVRGVNETVTKLKRGRDEIHNTFAKLVAHTSGEAKKHAPVDTGRLRASISFEVSGLSGRVYTNVDYAKYVEFGHRRIIVPVNAKALRFYLRGIGWVFAKRVEQGRTGKSATWEKVGDIIRKPFMKPAADWLRNQIAKLAEAFKRGVAQ